MRKKPENSAKRIAKFPPDRIAFLPTNTAAVGDKAVFAAYKQHKISIAMACRTVAENNNLPWVSREQFLNEFDICGWSHTMTEEEQETLEEYGARYGGAEE